MTLHVSPHSDWPVFCEVLATVVLVDRTFVTSSSNSHPDRGDGWQQLRRTLLLADLPRCIADAL